MRACVCSGAYLTVSVEAEAKRTLDEAKACAPVKTGPLPDHH